MNTSASERPIGGLALEGGRNGLDIAASTRLLRRYVVIERELMRASAGWFIAAPRYETKYALAAHLYDHAEHVTWLRQRLDEMRGGHVAANVEPALARAVATVADAEDEPSFLAGAYLEMKSALLATYRDHVDAADPCANAAELRVLKRMIPDLESHLAWAASAHRPAAAAAAPLESSAHGQRIRRQIDAVGGLAGLLPAAAASADSASTVAPPPFARPTTIVFDDRIAVGELVHDDQRRSLDAAGTTREDFKVFFNELYAASLLASVLYDAGAGELPWPMMHDLARHLWDEARHSEFGALRLTELGEKPSICNPVLFERAQSLPVLHRFCYLTMGLERYFMPRKRPRVRKYADLGDARSQLFADQDWNDETLHVTFGKRWMEHLLADDFRTVDDVLAEIRAHFEKVSGEKQTAAIAAPF